MRYFFWSSFRIQGSDCWKGPFIPWISRSKIMAISGDNQDATNSCLTRLQRNIFLRFLGVNFRWWCGAPLAISFWRFWHITSCSLTRSSFTSEVTKLEDFFESIHKRLIHSGTTSKRNDSVIIMTETAQMFSQSAFSNKSKNKKTSA